jgi:hypothetical protein
MPQRDCVYMLLWVASLFGAVIISSIFVLLVDKYNAAQRKCREWLSTSGDGDGQTEDPCKKMGYECGTEWEPDTKFTIVDHNCRLHDNGREDTTNKTDR